MNKITGYATKQNTPSIIEVPTYMMMELIEAYEFMLDIGNSVGWDQDEIEIMEKDKDTILLLLEDKGVLELYRK